MWYYLGHLIDTPSTNQSPTWWVIMNQPGFVGRYVLVQGLEQGKFLHIADPLENFQWVCIPHLCRKSWRCQTCHDRQQAQSQHMLVSRHNSGFWTVCATKALDKSEVSWKTVQLCAFLNCNLACRQFGEGWGVSWVWLWPGTFSKHHRPQGAARGYWLHGKGRGPRGRDGEHRPTRKFPVGLHPPSLP